MVQQEQVEEQLRRECEELRVQSQKELQQVQEDMARLQKEFNQSLLRAENEKQQVIFFFFFYLRISKSIKYLSYNNISVYLKGHVLSVTTCKTQTVLYLSGGLMNHNSYLKSKTPGQVNFFFFINCV